MSRPTKRWRVYLIRCTDGSLYCGITTDLKRRVQQHNDGTGSKYTRSRRPVVIVAVSVFMDHSRAATTEAYIKQLPKELKISALLSIKYL